MKMKQVNVRLDQLDKIAEIPNFSAFVRDCVDNYEELSVNPSELRSKPLKQSVGILLSRIGNSYGYEAEITQKVVELLQMLQTLDE